jgi:hypothetical protein
VNQRAIVIVSRYYVQTVRDETRISAEVSPQHFLQPQKPKFAPSHEDNNLANPGSASVSETPNSDVDIAWVEFPLRFAFGGVKGKGLS